MRKNSKKKKIAYAFIAPAIISILVFTVVPIIYTVFISFTNYNMYHLEDFNMVGIANYLEVIREASVRCFPGAGMDSGICGNQYDGGLSDRYGDGSAFE